MDEDGFFLTSDSSVSGSRSFKIQYTTPEATIVTAIKNQTREVKGLIHLIRLDLLSVLFFTITISALYQGSMKPTPTSILSSDSAHQVIEISYFSILQCNNSSKVLFAGFTITP
eukprot:CAMPEP_0194171830 /NCGR_PEP_ID=MMETSP0154-20130528/6391_1 /TAXON_ID=1049557 /ORGANISM="Thalassiothrix antarctica, Strain L6-D1" /LENGTH=113 /DNA_ID=CAMNT_0038884301 /DNA_START=977 /DNA_END=1318 /DNA_ORIENTATION=+